MVVTALDGMKYLKETVVFNDVSESSSLHSFIQEYTKIGKPFRRSEGTLLVTTFEMSLVHCFIPRKEPWRYSR